MQASIDEQKGTPWEGVALPYDGSINRSRAAFVLTTRFRPPCSILYGLNCRWVQESNRDLLLHPKIRQAGRSTESCYRWQLRVDHVSSRRVQSQQNSADAGRHREE